MPDGSWYAKPYHATVAWFHYNVIFCKAIAFISGVLFSHSFVESGVVGILVSYLEYHWKNQSLSKHAVAINVQEGFSAVLVIVVAYISDTFTGRFKMVLCCTIAYVTGLWLLYHSAGISKEDESVLYLYFAMVLIAVGIAVRAPTLDAFLEDQIRQQETTATATEMVKDRSVVVMARVKFWSVLNKILGAVVALVVFANLSYWRGAFLVSAIAMSVSGSLFLCGFHWYNYQRPTESALIDVYFSVKVAIRNRQLEYPDTPEQYYLNHRNDLQLSPHIAALRWLDRAAIKRTSSISLAEQERRGLLCPVSKVKGVKLFLMMVPMWTCFLFYGFVQATGSTFFFLQSSNMDDRVGGIKVPLNYFYVVSLFSSSIAPYLFEKLTSKPVKLKVKVGVGMFCSFLSCIFARLVEIHRLNLYEKKKSLLEGSDSSLPITVPFSILWLTPQFCLLGIMEGLCEDGLVEFYYSQVPKSMAMYGPSFKDWVLGVGKFLSIFLILTFSHWFGETVNESRLDNYYAILAMLSLANQILYHYLSRLPIYNAAINIAEEINTTSLQLQEIVTEKPPIIDDSILETSQLINPPDSSQRIAAASSSFTTHHTGANISAWDKVRDKLMTRTRGSRFRHLVQIISNPQVREKLN